MAWKYTWETNTLILLEFKVSFKNIFLLDFVQFSSSPVYVRFVNVHLNFLYSRSPTECKIISSRKNMGEET